MNVINEELAKEANNMNSFGDYEDGSATNAYNCYLKNFNEAVEKLKEKNKTFAYPATEKELELVDYYCDKFANKLAFAINKKNAIESMCPSVMICGAGNFPIKKKEKQNEAREKFYQEYSNLYQLNTNYYFNKIKNILINTTIKSDDALVLEKLRNKLQDLTEEHEKMKAYNSYYRKNGTMKGFEELSDEQAEKIDESIQNGFSWEKQPFPSYCLTNSNAKINSVKKRIANIEKLKTIAGDEEYIKVDGVQVVENAEAMRIQLMFDDIPNEETRSLLKHNGFRFSPRFKAWQRELNNNGKYAVKKILEQIK